MYGHERFKSARAFWSIIEDDVGEKWIVVDRLYADTKGLGHGTGVIEKLKKLSIRLSLPIKLHPWPDNPSNIERLKLWYISQGFWDTGDYFMWTYI